MSKTKLEFYKGNGSGEIEEDPDNYKAHFPNLEVMERAKNLSTFTAKSKDGTLGNATTNSSTGT